MIEAVKFWNEPNNLSHWDFLMDEKWQDFAEMTKIASQALRTLAPDLKQVLGGISPIDPQFMSLMKYYNVLNNLDAVAVHGFPLDWNHWKINEWPEKIKSIEDVAGLPVWVTEVGVSSFGAEEVQLFGLQKTNELLLDRVDRVYWYSLFDLPPAWDATTRHKESEGSSYYRHFYMGLINAEGIPKLAAEYFDPRMGICQWVHFEDHRLDEMVTWLKQLKVTRLRTGISWADWHRQNAIDWFDRQMSVLEEFDTTVTLCFTPPSRGKRADHTSPPIDIEEFASFACEVIDRYFIKKKHLINIKQFDFQNGK